jgi:hypothetical protein
MYKLNPNKYAQGLLKPVPIEETRVDKIEKIIPHNVKQKENEIKIIETVKVESEENIKLREEFENLVKTKLGKMDEVLTYLKDKYEGVSSEIKTISSANNNYQQNILNHLNKKNENENEVSNVKLNEKKQRTKKSYYKITDNMWTDVKSKFPDFPDNMKDSVYSNGDEFYVDVKNKKTLIDNKAILKILSKK